MLGKVNFDKHVNVFEMYCNGDTCNYMYIRHIYSPSLSRPKGPKVPVIILFLKKKSNVSLFWCDFDV